MKSFSKSKIAAMSLVLITASGLSSSVFAATNLITNGSFENTNNFVITQQGSMALSPGNTALTGWTVVNASNKDLAWIGPTNPFGITASNGSYSLDLTGWHDSAAYSGVSQSISTIIGDTYNLSFDTNANGAKISASAFGNNSLASSIFSNTQNTLNAWQTFSLSFTADSASTLVSLLGATAGGGGGGGYIGLDKVTVISAVPVPAAIWMFGTGLIGLGATMRKKAQA